MRQSLSLVSALFLLPWLAACQPVSTDEIPRTVIVTGEGEISVAPEIATVHLGVQARDSKLEAAQARAGEVVTAVLELADSLDVPREQIRSTQLHVQPEFDWKEGEQRFRGYLVQREVVVRLEDLGKLGRLLERAMEAGVNSIGSPQFDVKNPRELHREVLQLAATDAKAKAHALAQTLDAGLGDVRRVNSMDDMAPPRPMEAQMMRMSAADSQRAEQSYETGRITVRARVQAEFELR